MKRLAAEASTRALGLNPGNFRQIASCGFGDGHNSYAYCYAWYDNHAYVGTNRDILARIKMNRPFQMGVDIWPVPAISKEELRLGAQMWRYNFERRQWTKVYESPVVAGIDGTPTPLAIGFRNLQIFQGKSDPRPCLYTLPMYTKNIRGPIVLRSEDGLHFERTEALRMQLGSENVGSFRGVIPFKGRLWIAASGTQGGDPNVSENSKVHYSDDPVTGVWQDSSIAAFGDTTNGSILDLAVFDDHLYAGTLNIRQGFQVWRTDGEGPGPHRWERVLDFGCDRGPHNQAVLCFSPFRDALYIGTAIQNGGYDQKNEVGPAPSEVVRVFPDGTWDLVVGEPRMTRQGFKAPTSGLNAGFDNPLNGYFWRMNQHDGALYVGTYDFSSFLPYLDFRRMPDWTQRIFDTVTTEMFLKIRGGCEVWRTTDGDHWVPITRNGFGNHFNYGIRTILSTPHGVIIGTANPFGPRVAVKRGGVWHFEDNPKGGIEVWHGAHENTFGGGEQPLPGMVPLELGLPMGTEVLFQSWQAAEAESASGQRKAVDPLAALAGKGSEQLLAEQTTAEELRKYFGYGQLQNVGYWRSPSTTPRDACMELVAQLLGMPPEPEDGTRSLGDCLVIGAGPGELAWHVLHRKPESRVTALVTSSAEAERARDTEPRARLLRGSPGRWNLPAASFDSVLCVEGSREVKRQSAWRELYQCLRPGGWMLAAELWEALSHSTLASEAQQAELLAQGEQELRTAGFATVQLLDITTHGWDRFYRHSRSYFGTMRLFHQIDAQRENELLAELPGGKLAVGLHGLVCALKAKPLPAVGGGG